MLNEIIDVYLKQLELYNTLKKILEKLQNNDFDLITYNLEFENADFILNKIQKLNEKAEQLKLIYISKYNLNNFDGEAIKRIETKESYNRLREAINNVTSMIATVKRIQDSIINKINTDNNINKRVQRNFDKKSAVNTYISNLQKK